MYQTTYHRASSVEEAAKLLGDAEEAKLLAGGMTLIPTMKQRLASPSDVIDLGHIAALKGISVSGREVSIGAGTRHAEVAASTELAAVCLGICQLAGHIGDPHVRNRGTIGGSIANNDPAADYPAAMLAVAATIHTNKRKLAADDYFTGLFETALEPDEIIIAVTFTAPERSAYQKFPNPASRYALAGVFVAKGAGGVRVGVTGAGSDGAYRWREAERALTSNFAAGALDELNVDAGGMLSDMHADASYRANLVKVLAKRAVAAA